MDKDSEESEEQEEEKEKEEGEPEGKEAGNQEVQKEPSGTSEPDIKIVINMKGNRALVGIQVPDCDPVILTANGDLTEVLFNLAGYVEQAKKKWQATPKYPKSSLPQPAPAPVSTAPRTSTSSSKPVPKGSTPGKTDGGLSKPLF